MARVLECKGTTFFSFGLMVIQNMEAFEEILLCVHPVKLVRNELLL